MKAYTSHAYSKLFVLKQTQCFSASYILKQCHIHIVLIQISVDFVVLVQCGICLKFLSSFSPSFESFLNFKLSSTRLLIHWFLIKSGVFC